MTTVFIGSDHAGFGLKTQLLVLCPRRYQDVGCFEPESCDYPDIAHALARKVSETEGSFGVLICGTGEGMCMAANKHSGIRAGVAWKPDIAQAIREHNDANVLCLPAYHLTPEDAADIICTFLATPFSTASRHARRVSKINTKF